MTAKYSSVMGIFHNRLDVEYVIEKLKEEGFRNTHISVLLASNVGTRDFAHEKNTKTPEGATTGVTTGAVIGGVLGWLMGVGSLIIPGLGPFIAAGPIVALLAGAGAGGTIGGVVGALIGMGIPEYEAKRYEGLIKEGKALVSVHCEDWYWVEKARHTMAACGGVDVASQQEATANSTVSTTTRPHIATNTYNEKTSQPPIDRSGRQRRNSRRNKEDGL